MEMERLRQLIVPLERREEVGCASDTGRGTVDAKVGEGDERDATESSSQPGKRLTGSDERAWEETGRKDTERKETGVKTVGAKEMRGKETGVNETGAKETGAKETVGKETGGKRREER